MFFRLSTKSTPQWKDEGNQTGVRPENPAKSEAFNYWAQENPVDWVQYVRIAGKDKRLVKTPLTLRGWIYERTEWIKPAEDLRIPQSPKHLTTELWLSNIGRRFDSLRSFINLSASENWWYRVHWSGPGSPSTNGRTESNRHKTREPRYVRSI